MYYKLVVCSSCENLLLFKYYFFIYTYIFIVLVKKLWNLLIIYPCILVGAIKQRRLAANREHPYQRAAVGVPTKPGFIEIQ